MNMNYKSLDRFTQCMVQEALIQYWGHTFEIDDLDDYYSTSGRRFGYVAIDNHQRTVMVCDCTPDDGDTLIATIRF